MKHLRVRPSFLRSQSGWRWRWHMRRRRHEQRPILGPRAAWRARRARRSRSLVGHPAMTFTASAVARRASLYDLLSRAAQPTTRPRLGAALFDRPTRHIPPSVCYALLILSRPTDLVSRSCQHDLHEESFSLLPARSYPAAIHLHLAFGVLTQRISRALVETHPTGRDERTYTAVTVTVMSSRLSQNWMTEGLDL